MLFITHDLSVLTSTCRRLAMMYAGRIVEEGPSDEVFGQPAASVQPGAGPGLPDDRRPGVAAGAERPAGDPPNPADLPAGCPVPPRVRRGGRRRAGRSTSGCAAVAVARRAACVHVGIGRWMIAAARRSTTSTSRSPAGTARPRRRRRQPRGPARRGGRPRRRVRLRQDDADPLACSASSRSRRDGHVRRTACRLRRAAPSAGCAAGCRWSSRIPTGALNPRHTVYEAVAEGIRIHGVPGNEARARRRRTRSRPGCGRPSGSSAAYPHEISGGQRQRVLIAGAIALSPQLLLADEPVASLDASIRGEILAAAALARRRARAVDRRRHPRPRPGVEHRRPHRRDVPRPDRRAGRRPSRCSATRSTRTRRRCCRWCPRRKRVEQQILTGETPDPSAIPTGCRFHPRCPLVLSGGASALGVLDRCTGVARRAGAAHWRPATPCRLGSQR